MRHSKKIHDTDVRRNISPSLRLIDSGLALDFVPDKDEIQKCIDFGKIIAKRIHET